MNKIKYKCSYCKKDFLDWRCRRGKFCSIKCSSSSRIGVKLSQEIRNNMSIGRTGKKRSPEAIKNITKAKMGHLNPNWRGGVSSLRVKLIDSQNYKKWRAEVYKRDDWTCQHCGKRGVKLNADHIIPFFKDKSLVFDVNNGQTLCVKCHRAKTLDDMKGNWVNQHSNNTEFNCLLCGKLNKSKYRLCKNHYKAEWKRKNLWKYKNFSQDF